MIEFVYFDLGNVLWVFDETRACRNVADPLDRSVDQVHDAIYGSDLQTRFEHGTVSPRGFVNILKEKLDVVDSSIEDSKILDGVSDMFEPIESMVHVLQSVRDSGRKLGILSNTCHAHWDWLKRQSHELLAGRFDAIVLSFEVHSMKPDDQIYRAAELACGVPASKILFLDDRQENVATARSRGWNSVQCTGLASSEGSSVIDALQQYKVTP